jgi:hypothetical protein
MAPNDEWDQRRRGYTEDKVHEINPLTEEAIESVKIAVSYAQIGLKWGFLLNGGALVALPAIIGGLPEITTCSVKAAAVLYIVGLALCGVCTITAYLNFLTVSNWRRTQANLKKWQISNTYFGTAETQEDYKTAVRLCEAEISSLGRRIVSTYWIALVTGCTGYGAFIVASIVLVW